MLQTVCTVDEIKYMFRLILWFKIDAIQKKSISGKQLSAKTIISFPCMDEYVDWCIYLDMWNIVWITAQSLIILFLMLHLNLINDNWIIVLLPLHSWYLSTTCMNEIYIYVLNPSPFKSIHISRIVFPVLFNK